MSVNINTYIPSTSSSFVTQDELLSDLAGYATISQLNNAVTPSVLTNLTVTQNLTGGTGTFTNLNLAASSGCFLFPNTNILIGNTGSWGMSGLSNNLYVGKNISPGDLTGGSYSNVCLGNSIFYGATSGNNQNNVIVGQSACTGLANLQNCVYIGQNANFANNGSVSNTVVIGSNSSSNNSNNLLIGSNSICNGINNVMLSNNGNNTQGFGVLIGNPVYSFGPNTTNIGYNSGNSNLSNGINLLITSVGSQNLQQLGSSTSSRNTNLTCLGNNCLQSLQGGLDIVAVGTNAGQSYVGGYNGNTGTQANNIFIGSSSGKSSSGTNNVFIGSYCSLNATGSNNVVIGNNSLTGSNTGNNNIVHGNNIQLDNGSRNNCILLGNNSVTHSSLTDGQFVLGSSINSINTSSTASAGVNTLPANPLGFLVVVLNGNIVKIPYYSS